MVDLFLRRGFEMKILNRLFVGVHTLLGRGLTDGLERRVENLAGFWVRAPGCGQTVNHQIHLTEIRFNEIDHLRFHLIREGITV